MLAVAHLQYRPLDAEDLHGISTGKNLQRVSCLAHCLNFLVDLCSHLRFSNRSFEYTGHAKQDKAEAICVEISLHFAIFRCSFVLI